MRGDRPGAERFPAGLVGRHGPAAAAFLAALTALPGLRLPFLADDWADLAAVERGPTARTPFAYFRPLSMATYWLERRVYGSSPAAGHLINLVLMAAVAWLVVVAIRRYTGDALLAGVAGGLFALHPYHVESAAWIAARPDLLYGLFFLLAALSYDRWRAATAGLPWGAILLFEAALLCKEAAVTLPPFLVVLGWCDRRRRPTAPEWLRGLLPLFAVAAAHFLLLRPPGAAGPGVLPAGWPPASWLRNLLALGASSVIPAHTEAIEARPVAFGALAALAAGSLLGAARWVSGRVPRSALACVPVFAVLVGPHVISFQERYLLLPSAAAALAIALLLKEAGRRVGGAAAAAIVVGWSLSLAVHWAGWIDAGLCSRRLIDDLVEASRRPRVGEIVVANMPHRVHGAPVNGNFTAAVALSGGRPVSVRAVASIDYPAPSADALVGAPRVTGTADTPEAEVALRIPEERFSRYVWPARGAGVARLDRDWGTILFDGDGRLRVLIRGAPDGSRAAGVWKGGRLESLF